MAGCQNLSPCIKIFTLGIEVVRPVMSTSGVAMSDLVSPSLTPVITQESSGSSSNFILRGYHITNQWPSMPS